MQIKIIKIRADGLRFYIGLTRFQEAWSLVYDRILGLIEDDPHAAPAIALSPNEAQDYVNSQANGSIESQAL